jgi:hypothetical protein
MCAVETKGPQSGGSKSDIDRTQKAAATRRITAEKRSKLSEQNSYAYGKVNACRQACDKMADRLLNGGTATGELLDACAQVEAEIGKAMFK